MLFSILDKIVPLTPNEKLHLFHMLTSLFSAFSLTAIILWFYWEFGLLAGLFVLASVVLSQWLVVFGRNLWWSMWAFYLPMVAVMHYLRDNRAHTKSLSIKFGRLVFITVFIKCLFNGYEYITTTLIMMIVPLVYYSILYKLSFYKFRRNLFAAALSTCLAILLSLFILCFQISSVTGSLLNGVDHIVSALNVRTYADPSRFHLNYKPSLESNTATVIVKYLTGTFFDLNNIVPTSKLFVSSFIFKIRYLYLISLFLLMSVFLFFRRNRCVSEKEKQSNLALIFAAWVSILAPLSWFIIFKSHSYIHVHINYIVWQMPFTLFGFAVCGVVVKSIFGSR